MITLLHGDDIVKSRNELNLIRSLAKDKEVRVLAGKTVTDSEFMQALSSNSLFGGDTLVIIESLFSGLGKKIKRIEQLLTMIKAESSGCDVVLWEEKEVGKTVMTNLGTHGVTVRLFKLPTILFQFLDSIAPKNPKFVIPLYRQLVSQEAPELVHAMIVRRIRQLFLLKGGCPPAGIQPWQLTRLTNQGRMFTMDELRLMYQKLLEHEVATKTGTTTIPIVEATEQLFIESSLWH